jgi:hypothetical protein
MKKILFFLLIPFLALSQDVVTDTVYIQKQDSIYFIVTMTTFSDSTVTGNKQILGDSLTAIKALVTDAERQSNTIAIHAKPLILKGKAVRRINYYNSLHLQISGRPVYTSTALRDTTAFLGTWNLNFDGEIILGEIQLNNNNRFIFNPDNGKVYSISTNLLLSTFTNQISFAFNGVRYDLYKFANGKFATVDGEVRLIKKE